MNSLKNILKTSEKKCDNLDKQTVHFNTTYEDHKKYGEKVYKYQRNQDTTWYIIYNIKNETIYIEKIINNYNTAN